LEAIDLSINFSIRSSSTHPPDNDPTVSFSDVQAKRDPSGLGDEPHVFTTVASQHFLLSESHRSRVFKTSLLSASIFVVLN